MRRIIVGSEPEVAEQYQRHFRAETDLAIKILAEAYSEFQRLGRQVAQEPRCATVQLFVHVSINSVVTSMHHLVHGYPIASGNMMRHFTEAIAMAMLCADERTGVYARYQANRAHFDVDSASDLLTRKVNKKFLTQSLGFDSDAWSTVRKQVKLYNKLSHASGPALGYQFLFDVTGGLVLGAAFDPAKVDYYRSDLVRRRTAAAALKQVVPIILAALPRRSETGA
jgi:hypothetical protein